MASADEFHTVPVTREAPWSGLFNPKRQGNPAGRAGVTVKPLEGRATVCVMARRGGAADLAKAFAAAQLTAPEAGRRLEVGGFEMMFDGPDKWRAVSTAHGGPELERHLRAICGATASIVDISHGAAALRITGPSAVDVLMRGTSLDVEAGFCAGDAALVSLGHMPVHLSRLTDEPEFEVQVFRSMAKSFSEWLLDSAAQFGVQIA